jgi:hypothetical protein
VLVSFSWYYGFVAVSIGDATVCACVSRLMVGVWLYQLCRHGSYELAVRVYGFIFYSYVF